ncbi:MAG TPA: hypothetical protein VKT73_07215 [Xanthobacteraceae bacterium]|nr:hypothetical protein [Xanthobacteraceae bacterium]
MRNGVVRVLAISIGFFACGCGDVLDRYTIKLPSLPAPSAPSSLYAQDENNCRARGLSKDYDYAFDQCLKQVAAERAEAEAAAKAPPLDAGDNNPNPQPQ